MPDQNVTNLAVRDILSEVPGTDTPSNLLGDTLSWFREAVPAPTRKNLQVQLGCHFEEVAEMLEAIDTDSSYTAFMLRDAQNALSALATHLKTRDAQVVINPDNAEDFLDACCDQVVTATGVAHMKGDDILGAIGEVNASNFSKFVGGRPVFDENRKIQKGPDYFKAKLARFVGAFPRET